MQADKEADAVLKELADGPTDLARLVERYLHRRRPWLVVSADAAAAYERREPRAWAKLRSWLAAQGVKLVEVEGVLTRSDRIQPPAWSPPMARQDPDPGLGRAAPLGVQRGDLRASMEVVRRIVTDWDTFAEVVEALTREHAELRGSFERLGRENQALRESHERLKRAHAANLQVLTDLRGANDLLRHEHEAGKRALNDLQERYEALRQDRQYTNEELQTVLRRLRPWGHPPA